MRLFRSPIARAALLGASTILAVPGTVILPAAVTATPAHARPAPDSFADLAAKLLPAVVNISSSQTVQARNGGPNSGPEVPMFPPGRARCSRTVTARDGAACFRRNATDSPLRPPPTMTTCGMGLSHPGSVRGRPDGPGLPSPARPGARTREIPGGTGGRSGRSVFTFRVLRRS